MGKLGMTWSCNAKAKVPYKTLKVMKDNGLRLLLVGFESGDDQILHNIKKDYAPTSHGASAAIAESSAFLVHGTFILAARRNQGNHREDHQLREGDQSHTIQVSLAAPSPEPRSTNNGG